MPHDNKKIISITWYKVLPPKFGGQKGIALFNHYLSRLHPLACVCSGNNEVSQDIPYKVLPVLPVSKSQFLQPSVWKKIKDIAKKERATHILLEHPYHGLAAVRAKKATGVLLIIHSHNIEFQRFRQTGKWWWRLLKSYEKWVHRKADLNLFKTEEDRAYAIEQFGLNASQCIVVPYGIEKPVAIDKPKARQLIRARHGIQPDEKILLFAGTLDYKPNALAVESIFNELAPRLLKERFAGKIIICGRNQYLAFHYLQKLSHPAVIIAGEVADINNYFAAADVFINPVRSGGGVQTKNMDALAYDCNVVCFSTMNPAAIVKLAGNKLFMAADWPSFIKQLLKASQQQEATPAAFFEEYNWQKIVANFNKYI
jgi:glycosyltransferase involved in cell wall biosynthesis